MEVKLHIGTLGLVFFRNQGPSSPGGGTIGKTYLCCIRKPLREVIGGNGVLIFPLDDSGHFLFGWHGSIDRLRAGVDPREVCPSTCHLYHVTEAHLEDGPVRAVVLEAWDVGWEFFEVGRSGGGRRCGGG